MPHINPQVISCERSPGCLGLEDKSDRGHQGEFVFHWQENSLQHKKKCLVVSISAPQSHIGFTAFLKI